jgi:glycosyltransferase involved in cell wall biosynthesis
MNLDLDVSIVTGTLNRLALLQRLLDSIQLDLQPSKLTHEIIIVDGGSTDGTLEYLRSTDVRLIEQGQRLGSTKAFDAGFAQARGRYVVNLNDDAAIHPSVIPSAVQQVAIPYHNPKPDDRVYVRDVEIDGVRRAFANFGVTRRALGETLGWWRSDLYRQYGGDTHLSWAIWEVGYRVESMLAAGYIEHFEAQDATRRGDNIDAATFFNFWSKETA